MTSFSRYSDVITASCFRWDVSTCQPVFKIKANLMIWDLSTSLKEDKQLFFLIISFSRWSLDNCRTGIFFLFYLSLNTGSDCCPIKTTGTEINSSIHDDVIKWKHVRGIHRFPVNSPHKGQWRGALVFSLICTLNKRLSKQSLGMWFETPSRWLWRHCNDHQFSWDIEVHGD